MPYIAKQRREPFLGLEKYLKAIRIDTPGELNYLITVLSRLYIQQHGLNYRILNEVEGVISCVEHEMYRRVLAQYETDKAIENGDVWNIKED